MKVDKVDSARERRRQRKDVRAPRTSATRDTDVSIRLNRFLAEAGIASRRKADGLIASGAVKVNGKKVTALGSKVNPGADTVSVHNSTVRIEPKLVYILLNKPKDCITTASDEKGRRTVLELVPPNPRVFPVGRLDRNTTGALLLTNDGDLAFRLMHPRYGVLKTYRVTTERGIQKTDLMKLTSGLAIGQGEQTAPCEALILDSPKNRQLLVRLHEGKYRQIRRMFKLLGYEVSKLDRIEYANLSIEGTKRGEWRYLTDREIRLLHTISKQMSSVT